MRVSKPGVLWPRYQLVLPVPVLHELLPAGEELLVPDIVVGGEGGGDLAERLPVLVPRHVGRAVDGGQVTGRLAIELQTKVHIKVCNHGEGL